jgi:hypothetical protein
MAQEREYLEVGQSPEILRLAEEVSRSGLPRVLRRNGEPLAIVRPIASSSRRRSGSVRPPPTNAWLEGLIGISESDGSGDVSANVHRYVADAVRAEADDRPR